MVFPFPSLKKEAKLYAKIVISRFLLSRFVFEPRSTHAYTNHTQTGVKMFNDLRLFVCAQATHNYT